MSSEFFFAWVEKENLGGAGFAQCVLFPIRVGFFSLQAPHHYHHFSGLFSRVSRRSFSNINKSAKDGISPQWPPAPRRELIMAVCRRLFLTPRPPLTHLTISSPTAFTERRVTRAESPTLDSTTRFAREHLNLGDEGRSWAGINIHRHRRRSCRSRPCA